MSTTQNKHKRLRLLFLFVVIDATRAWFAGAAVASDYAVYVVEPAINNLAIQPHRPLPSTCRAGSALRVACRWAVAPDDLPPS